MVVYNSKCVLKKLLFILSLLFLISSVYSQEVIINEVNVNPSGLDTSAVSSINANSLYNIYTNYQPAENREWIELYNPSSIESVDIGCYTLGANASNYSLGDNWGALTFPSGTIIPPNGYLIVGGNASDVPILDFDLNYYRYNFFQIAYLDGDYYRWFLRNSFGWIAIYNPNGEVVDAVYWTDTIGDQSSLYDQEEFFNPIYSITTCSGDMSFLAAIDIPNIEFIGIVKAEDSTFQRIPDGGEWSGTQDAPTPRNCNGGCYDYNFQNVCAADIMHFNVVNLTNNQVDSAYWDFGDYPSGILNFSDDTVTSHYYANAGNYDVKLIVYFNNFSDTIIKTVTVFNNPQVNLGPDIILCPNKTAILHAGAGFSNYLWNTNSYDSLLIVSTPGNYWVQVNLGSCIDADTLNISFYDTNLLSLGNDTSICENESITLNAGNGYTSYLWQNSSTSQVFTTSQTGTYWVETTDVNFCVQRDSIILDVQQMPFIELGNDTLVCDNPSMVLNALNTGSNYLWSTNEISQQINVSTSGAYYLTVTNNCGVYIDSISVSFNQKPQFTLNDTTICEGDSAIISIANIYDNYLWSTGETSNVVTFKDAGTYSVSVTNICGVSSKSVIIDAINPPLIDLGNDTLVCNETSIILNAQSVNSTYIWSSGQVSSQISISEPDKYSVTVTNQCGYDTSSINIRFDSTPEISLIDTAFCKGDSIYFAVDNSMNNILWSTGDTLNNIFLKEAGEYTVKLSNSCGNIIDTFRLAQIEKPILFLGIDTVIEQGNYINLIANYPNTDCIWNTGDTSHSISVYESGYYWASLKNLCGVANDTIHIEVYDCDINVFIPNTFSPNGDGLNDAILIKNDCNTDMSFDVYSRWGALVYRSSAKVITWEGTTFSGAVLSEGVYYYVLTYQNIDNKNENITGFIQLFK